MKTIAISSLYLLLFVFVQKLQAQNLITGIVNDASGKPLAFTNVLLLKSADSSLVRGITTTDQGTYKFENAPKGNFLLAYSMMGFKQRYSARFVLDENTPRINLEAVALQESGITLNAATVTAKRPFLEQKIDRTIVNVSNSITNAGSNALQVLQRSPGLDVDNNGISMMGKQGVTIMINGKISQQAPEAIVQMLGGMNSDNIDRIELIHTPPANFDAEGNAGIINIILKNTGDTGLNGGYSAKLGYGRGKKYGAGTYFNYRKNKMNWYGNYDYSYDLKTRVSTNYRSIRQGTDLLETKTYGDRFHTPLAVQLGRLGADFQLSKKTTLGLLGTLTSVDNNQVVQNDATFLKNGVVQSRLRIPNTEQNQTRSFVGNINLAHQFSNKESITIDADYITYKNTDPSFYTVNSVDDSGVATPEYELRIGKSTPIHVAVFKTDYARSVGKNLKIEAGGKVTFTRFDNDTRIERRDPQQDWIAFPEFTALVHLKENIAAAYSAFSLKINPKTNLKAGLRYEHTRSNLGSVQNPNIVDRRYGNWFPSVYLSHKLSETQNLNFSYSRRITRPALRQLAPWVTFLDPSNLLTGGNPALQPAFTDALKVDYGFKSVRLSLAYSLEKNPIRFYMQVDTLKNQQFLTAQNLGEIQTTNASLSLPFHPTKWWGMQNNLLCNYMKISYILEGKAFQNQGFNFAFNSTQTFTLPQDITLELSGNYRSLGYFGIQKTRARGAVNIAIQKKLSDRWGKLSLNVNDIFVSNTFYNTFAQPEINLLVKTSDNLFTERVVMLSWTNTFGNKKLKAARKRETGSAEEVERL